VDARLYHQSDGGEINVTNGDVELSDGLETAAYLSLFGGNERDSGSDADVAFMWWGSIGEPIERQYRSELQNLLRALPAVPFNLKRIEDAAVNDLAWMTTSLAKSVNVIARIPALNTVQISVAINLDGQVINFTFTSGWQKQ
jgi:phage gp46-like protein